MSSFDMSWNDIIKAEMSRRDYINALYHASEFISMEMTDKLWDEFQESYPHITSNNLDDVADKLEILGDWLRKTAEN